MASSCLVSSVLRKAEEATDGLDGADILKLRQRRRPLLLCVLVVVAVLPKAAAKGRFPSHSHRLSLRGGIMGKKRPAAKATNGAADAANKRRAADDQANDQEGTSVELSSPLSPHVLQASNIKRLKSEFKKSVKNPYSHCVLEELCDKNRLRAVHDELVNNLSANLKESDLFKVYQVDTRSCGVKPA